MTIIRRTVPCFLIGSLCLTCGCATKAGSGALIGGGLGAAAGGGIGSLSHQRAGEGAIIGGAIGALGGAIVGNSMDEADKRREREETSYGTRQPWHEVRHTVTQEDVINWSRDGLRDDIIIDRIQREGATFRLSARDENRLRDSRVSETVIMAMRDSGRR